MHAVQAVALVAATCLAIVRPLPAAEMSPISTPEISADRPENIAEAKKSGAAAAKKDIKAGMLRILYFGKPWSLDKPLVDDATGYRVQIVAGCDVTKAFSAAVEAYNQAVRSWHSKDKSDSHK